MNKAFKVSILLKIAGLSSGFLLIAVFVLAVYSINQNVSLVASTAIVQNKLRGDLNSVHYIITDVYGELRLENNHLCSSHHFSAGQF